MNEVLTFTGGWWPLILLALAAGGCLTAGLVVLAGLHLPPAAPETDESYSDARAFTCPKCDDQRPWPDCICIGDCGRRHCKWATMHGGDDDYNAAIARLHAALDAADGGHQ